MYTQPDSEPRLDLRERRRRELARTIAAAAVELFEHRGYTATTVDDIAAAAGVSRTTFFRHCTTKESAVLVDDAGLESALVDIAANASPEHPLADLEQAWQGMTQVFDEDADGRDRFLRVRRLMNDNPALLAAGLERDARMTGSITTALVERTGLTVLDGQAVAATFALGMRLSFDEWVRASGGGASPSLGEIYPRVRAALARVVGSS